jgi:hypothetical protein
MEKNKVQLAPLDSSLLLRKKNNDGQKLQLPGPAEVIDINALSASKQNPIPKIQDESPTKVPKTESPLKKKRTKKKKKRMVSNVNKLASEFADDLGDGDDPSEAFTHQLNALN